MKKMKQQTAQALWLFPLLLIALLASCKDNEEKFGLSADRLNLNLYATSELSVYGSGSFNVSATSETIISHRISGNNIELTALAEGTTTLIVTSDKGETAQCLVIVKENTLDLKFTTIESLRAEQNESQLIAENESGFYTSTTSGKDALGGENKQSRTFDFTTIGDEETFYRFSAEGDFSLTGELSDGLIIINRNGSTQYATAYKTILRQIKNGKLYIIFYAKDNNTYRIVCPS